MGLLPVLVEGEEVHLALAYLLHEDQGDLLDVAYNLGGLVEARDYVIDDVVLPGPA